MNISITSRYALNLMIDLAEHDAGMPIRLREIAQRQEVSERYLEKIIALLHRAGYVKSTRGAHGGYTLNRNAQEYTVGMILRITEGRFVPVSYVGEERSGCKQRNQYETVRLVKQINDAVDGVVDTITIQNLIDWRNESRKAMQES